MGNVNGEAFVLTRQQIWLIGSGFWAVMAVAALWGQTRGLEQRLFREVNQRLAEHNLRGFAVRQNGQKTQILLARNGLEAMNITSPEALDKSLSSAKSAVQTVGGGLFSNKPHFGIFSGPITAFEYDAAMMAEARLRLSDKKPHASAAQIAVAKSCTEAVAKTIGSRKLAFVSDSAALSPESDALLDEIYKTIVACPESFSLSVEGHTDLTGTRGHNLTLSEERAKSASDALIKRGLKAENVTSTGFGPDRPLVAEKSPEADAKNRRVEFILKAQ